MADGSANEAMIWDEWPAAVRPKIRMFFSCDLVGSTALKQATRTFSSSAGEMIDNTAWFDIIQDFYIIIVDRFFAACRAIQPPDGGGDAGQPRVWKTAGDEVLFWAELTDSRLLHDYVCAWKRVCEGVRATLKTYNDRLDVKCTMWTAQFPWRNKMIFSSRLGSSVGLAGSNNLKLMVDYLDLAPGGECDFVPDFVGPGIDIGFRLSTYATSRRFVVSIEIAYILAVAAQGEEQELDFKIHCDGMQPFKGVLGGMQYPVFWIEMSTQYQTDFFERDLGKRECCDTDKIESFLRLFFEDTGNYLYTPFIVSPTEKYLTAPPTWYDAAHRGMLEASGIGPSATSPD